MRRMGSKINSKGKEEDVEERGCINNKVKKRRKEERNE